MDQEPMTRTVLPEYGCPVLTKEIMGAGPGRDLSDADKWYGGPAITEDEANLLTALVRAGQPHVVVEVGTGTGRSLLAMRNGYVGEPEGTINPVPIFYSCDTADAQAERARRLVPDAHIIDGSAVDMMAEVLESPELAFIDGQHDYESVSSDYREILRAVTDMCLFVFHDGRFPGVKQLMSEIGAFVLPTTFGMGLKMVKQ